MSPEEYQEKCSEFVERAKEKASSEGLHFKVLHNGHDHMGNRIVSYEVGSNGYNEVYALIHDGNRPRISRLG